MTDVPDDDLVYAVWERLPNEYDVVLWSDGDELAAGFFTDRTYTWWRELLGHPQAHRGCCKTCGCATSCTLGVFYDAVVASTIRELIKQGIIPGLVNESMDPIKSDDGAESAVEEQGSEN